eukprot:NODE_4508_length_667_cov_304.266340.p3 GENE.NODE_4508_length_667_cov_304.266340~~NODE_4508_length_667_cov_304.266340.p3  ORF type:complete len:64 (-),score=4.88 NODE_4508_length_667_cov_304.266340:15-206(-)
MNSLRTTASAPLLKGIAKYFSQISMALTPMAAEAYGTPQSSVGHVCLVSCSSSQGWQNHDAIT